MENKTSAEDPGERPESRESGREKKNRLKEYPNSNNTFFFSPPTPYTLLKNHVGMKIGHIPFFQGSKLRAGLNSYIYMYGIFTYIYHKNQPFM